jgi:hypothetical protein
MLMVTSQLTHVSIQILDVNHSDSICGFPVINMRNEIFLVLGTIRQQLWFYLMFIIVITITTHRYARLVCHVPKYIKLI